MSHPFNHRSSSAELADQASVALGTAQTATRIVGSCRFCGDALTRSFVDLGATPLCQRHVTPENFGEPEPIYPLHAYVCTGCRLVQLPDHVAPSEIFSDYAFFSGVSETWRAHVADYAEEMIGRLGLLETSLVVEVASNDGTLLQAFRRKLIPVRGIEPAENVADVARKTGIPTDCIFLGQRSAERFVAEHGRADLVAANNVFAHVPDLNDFVHGLVTLLKPEGVLTVEFPHLRNLLQLNQFDTIYHEHWSYYWITTAKRIFEHHGLRVFDVKEVDTHGGSARVYCCRADVQAHPTSPRVARQIEADAQAGFNDDATYDAFAERVRETKRKLLSFLIDAKRSGKRIVGYGAPGKGNTLLNYCGIGTDFLDFTVDRNPKKAGNFLPGSRIPICTPDAIDAVRPDYVLILPWNLKDEIMRQIAHVRHWGGRFVVPIPEVTVW